MIPMICVRGKFAFERRKKIFRTKVFKKVEDVTTLIIINFVSFLVQCIYVVYSPRFSSRAPSHSDLYAPKDWKREACITAREYHQRKTVIGTSVKLRKAASFPTY